MRDYAGAQACDLEAYGAWCRALLARGVYPPPSQFEAWFPLARPHRRARRAHRRGRRRRVRGGRGVTRAGEPVLRRLAAVLRDEGGLLAGAVVGDARTGADAALGALAAAGPRAAGHRDDVALVVEADPRGLPPALRRPRASSAPTTPTWRCWPATASTRSASRGWPRSGDLDAVGELADVIALCAQAQAEGAPSWPTRPGRRARQRSAGGRATARAAKAHARAGAGAPAALEPRRARLAATWRPYGSRPACRPGTLVDFRDKVRSPQMARPPTDQVASTPPTAGSRAPSRARPSRAGAS